RPPELGWLDRRPPPRCHRTGHTVQVHRGPRAFGLLRQQVSIHEARTTCRMTGPPHEKHSLDEPSPPGSQAPSDRRKATAMPRSPTIVAVPDSERFVRLGARQAGSIDPTEHVEVTVYVRSNPEAPPLPSPDELGALPPQERKLPTDEEFFASYGADPD